MTDSCHCLEAEANVYELSFLASSTAVSCTEEHSCQRAIFCIFITLFGQPCA